jgi:hypothetical protein
MQDQAAGKLETDRPYGSTERNKNVRENAVDLSAILSYNVSRSWSIQGVQSRYNAYEICIDMYIGTQTHTHTESVKWSYRVSHYLRGKAVASVPRGSCTWSAPCASSRQAGIPRDEVVTGRREQVCVARVPRNGDNARKAIAPIDIDGRNMASLLYVADIPEIPENIKNLRSLQVADFSSNPIPR